MGFKPKDDTGLRIGRDYGAQFNKERFIEAVFNQEYILVVGSKAIMDYKEEPTGDVNNYILSAINRSLHSSYEDYDDVVKHSAGTDPIRNLLNSEEDFSYDIDDISPELCGLINTKLFPIVLTTTVDHYLETLMYSVWGTNLKVVNIDDSKSLNDLRDTLIKCREKERYNTPTLVYLFGKAEKDESKHFVKTEDDAIRIMEKWMQFPKDDAVLQFVRSKKLLALGCKFDDWYFRTFWYILKHDFEHFADGEVAMELDDNDRSDRNLKRYFSRKKIYNHGDARLFMRTIEKDLTSLEPDNSFRAMVLSHRRKGGVFLSYCAKNVLLAGQLFVQLCAEDYKVWYDNNALRGGDIYDKEIKDAIKKSSVMITLLSPEVASDLIEGKTSPYYQKEWAEAVSNNLKIIPVAISGYDIRGEAHSLYKKLIGSDKATCIDLSKHDGLSQLFLSLDKYLTNDVR